MRIHAVALTTFRSTISHEASAHVAALCVVLMAEIGQVIFTLAAATNAKKKSQERLLLMGAIVATAIALFGNWYASADSAFKNPFTFLETFAPPVLVLVTSWVLKSQMLDAVETHFAARREYKNAVAVYAIAIENADAQPQWERTLANTLRDAIRNANRRSTAVLRDLTREDWIALVMRERNAEEWYPVSQSQVVTETQPAPEPIAIAPAPRAVSVRSSQTHTSGRKAGKLTGELANAIMQTDAGYVGVCPHCDFKTQPKAEYKQANTALSAHMKSHRKTQTEQPIAIAPGSLAGALFNGAEISP